MLLIKSPKERDRYDRLRRIGTLAPLMAMGYVPPDASGCLWSGTAVCEGLQVLYDGRKVELVAGAGETSQAHALEPMVGLEMRESHFDSFPLIA